ncbi:MAG TPA: hypothetical protein VH591_18625 [Ktedonobacterales bacterium]|jgi:hypothetical protein
MHALGPRQWMVAALSLALLLMALGVGGCALPTLGVSSAPTSALPAGGQWGFPFRAGTQVKLGDYGLHDDNYHGVPDFTLDSAALTTSALDIVPIDQSAPTAVIPLARGQILAWVPACHFLLVNHYNGVWVGYQHLDLNPQLHVGSVVDRSTMLGYTADAPINTPNCETSTARHVHIAFLSGSGNVGSFVTMVGQSLCGHTVTTSAPTNLAPHGGAIVGLASAPGQQFTVPDCDQGIVGTVTGTATPTTIPTATSQTTGATLCKGDWSRGLDGWTGTSAWKAINGTLVNDGTDSDSLQTDLLLAPCDLSGISSYTLEVTIQVVSQGFDPGFFVFVRYTKPDQGYILGVTDQYDAANPLSGLTCATVTGFYQPFQTAQFVPGNGLHTYVVALSGNHIRLMIDNHLYLDVIDSQFASGSSVGLAVHDTQLIVSSFRVVGG